MRANYQSSFFSNYESTMTIKEKIKGAIYGMALGDALGLGTEFMTKHEVQSYYPEGLTDFSQFIKDMHRSMHTAGQWTHDTEVILRMLDATVDNDRLRILPIAQSLLDWYNEGQMDVVAPYRIVIPSEGWVENPIVVAHRAWRNNHILDASNEALNRSLLIGVYADEETPIPELARRLVSITHDDTRCIATTAVASYYVHQYLYHDREPDFEDVRDLCESIDERAFYFIKMAREGRFDDIHIDDEETWWYTRKSLAAVLWAIWNCSTPEEILHKLVNAGGDADTNASLGLMLAGLKYGYDALPPIKEKLIDKYRLDNLSDRLTKSVERLLAKKS